MDNRIRASDEDRERIVQALHQHTTNGRLTLDEFTARIDAAHRAVTLGDLAGLTADLPELPARRRNPRRPMATRLVVAVAFALVLAVLLGAGAVAQAADLLHMEGVMSAMGNGMGAGCH